MNISNFEQEIEEKILSRGKDYFDEDHVEDLWQDGDTYFATVEGSEHYEVTVTLDGKGEILSSYCGCPYDWGEHCKHEVAVYYALREQLNSLSKDHKKKKTPSLEQAVRTIPREELEALVLDLAKRDRTLRQTILLTYSDSDDKSVHCKRLLEKAVLNYSENSYQRYYSSSDCLPEIDTVLQQAERELNPVRALRLLFTAADTLLEHVGDDFDGGLVHSIGILLGAVYDLAEKAAESAKQKQACEFFRFLLNKALKPSLDGWSDWRMDLLQACALFGKTPKLRSELEQALDRFAQNCSTSTEDYSKRYELEQVLLLRLSLLEYVGETEQAEELLYSHLDLPDFRKRAIEEEIKKENYDSALRLCREGVGQDQEYAGLVQSWKRYMLEIYRQTEDLAGLRESSRFLALRGELDVYREYKQSFSSEEWEKEAKKEFLTSLQKQPGNWNIYPEVLKLEGECSLLLDYCEKFPRELLSYLPDLVEAYPDETDQLYRTLILESARAASDRKQYQKVCNLLLSYGKTFGRTKQTDICEELRASYLRRPAFQEELGKMK